MSSQEKCTYCPREVMYEKFRELIEVVRNWIMNESKDLLDEEVAREFAMLINESGFLPEPFDVEKVRQMMARNFDLLDDIEEFIKNKRASETQFCIGALRLRAKDARTQYNVAICRSPQDAVIPLPNDLALYVVTKQVLPSPN